MENRIDLDALEAALAKSTPGRWRRGSRDEYVVVHLDHGYIVCDEDPEDDNAERVEADTDIIIAAHNALPALIAELRELRAESAAIKARAWQSIETAPKNGTGFLAWNESLRIVEASCATDLKGLGNYD